MLPDRISNPGPLTYESAALPIALRGPALKTSYYIVYAHGHRQLSVNLLLLLTDLLLCSVDVDQELPLTVILI